MAATALNMSAIGLPRAIAPLPAGTVLADGLGAPVALTFMVEPVSVCVLEVEFLYALGRPDTELDATAALVESTTDAEATDRLPLAEATADEAGALETAATPPV
jgi:hypothetical protein